MRVLLIKPNNLCDHIQPSLGLGYLAQQIRRNHDVTLFDCIKNCTPPEDIGLVVEALRPHVVGVQCYTFDVPNVKRMLRVIKRCDPAITTVVGGAHVSADPIGACRAFGKDLDYGFNGEAELGFGPFLHALESKATSYAGIPGVIWPHGDQFVVNPPQLAENLDDLGLPALDLLRPDTYPESQHGAFYNKFPISPILTTRGCPHACTFCSAPILSGRRLRHHSVEYLQRMIRILYAVYGIREIHIVDDNFTQDIDYAKSVLRMILDMRLDLSLALPNGIRMDRVDDELLEMMKAAGVYVVSVAVESGNDLVLKAMNKKTTVHKMRENVARIRRHGLDVAAFFILGFPGETRETIRDTVRLSRELDLIRANFFTYLPLPGTASYRDLVDSGEIEKVNWNDFKFMSAAYVPRGMTRNELLSLKRRAFLGFYLRPWIFTRNLLAIRSCRHFHFLLKRFYHWMVMKPAESKEHDPRRPTRSLAARLRSIFSMVKPAPAAHVDPT